MSPVLGLALAYSFDVADALLPAYGLGVLTGAGLATLYGLWLLHRLSRRD
jgi:hypothetical protein